MSLAKCFTSFHFNWSFRKFNPHWQSGGIIIFLCKYYIIISDTLVGTFLDVLFLLLAVRLSGLYEKPRKKKDWVQKKVHRRICVRDINFFNCTTSFLCHFCCFFPAPSQVTQLLNRLYKDTKYCYGWYSVWWYHKWTVENMKISCNLILADWNLQERDIF